MSILSHLGRQAIRLGSGPDVELRLEGSGISPVHAEIVHQGQGRLLLVPGNVGPCYWDDRLLEPGVPVPFDFRSRFYLASTEVPLIHPAICEMVMRRGLLPAHPQELVVGRDPERCHLVLTSPGVSGRHATLTFPGPLVVDHHSTSGTWHEGQRLPEDTPVPLAESGLIAVGPLPLPLDFAACIHAELQSAPRPAQAGATQAMKQAQEAPAPSLPVPAQVLARHRTLMGTVRMEMARDRTIGRTSDNDIVLDHPQVSSRHAKLVSVGSGLFLEDSGSELGTYVRGAKLKPGQRVPVEDGEKVQLGPMSAVLRIEGSSVDFLLEDQADWAGRPLFEIEARHLSVEVPDRDAPSNLKLLLDDVSFRALPGDLIALMGPSGSGKTTLLHLLTAYRTPSRGQVLVNGEPLETIFDALRGSIGYVPQDDIIHPELTVWEAVRYSARLRLPRDYTDEEIDERVRRTLDELGLESVSHLEIGKPEAKVLSGGQRKRVNIALELVTDPVLLFLDEPTSGLAADDTAALVELLAHLAKTAGKTILATIHQPAKYEYEKFNLALVLGAGGIPIYFGPTREAYRFFENWRPPGERAAIDTPRDMFAELAEREARQLRGRTTTTRAALQKQVARQFREEYEQSAICEAMHSGTREVGGAVRQRPPLASRVRPHGQLALLLSRYLRVKARDKVGTAILLLQAPVIGGLLALVFGSQKPAAPFWCLGALQELARRGDTLARSADGVLSRMQPTRDYSGALFFLVVAAVWFGTSNAAREIVSERAIYRRERMVNLGIPEYVLSKFLVLAALSAVQCTVLLSIVFGALNLSGGGPGFFMELSMLVLTSFCSVALGLLISALVQSSEAAMALTPIALIPQVVLGGLMVPVTTVAWLWWPMLAVPARWGFEGVVRVERLAQKNTPAWLIPLDHAPDSPPDFIANGAFHCAEAQLKSKQFLGAWGLSSAETPAIAASILALMTCFLLVLVMVRLKGSDR